MNPIKNPENYPSNWEEVREVILDRAGSRCECEGECGEDHASQSCIDFFSAPVQFRCREMNRTDALYMRGKVVLTLAHLDHDAAAGDHSQENLKAMCQACHLRYDGAYRRERQRQLEELQKRYLTIAMSWYECSTTDNGDGTYTHEWRSRK